MAQVILEGPMVDGRSRQVGDRQIHHAERAWVLRVSLVGIGRVWVEERKRERDRDKRGRGAGRTEAEAIIFFKKNLWYLNALS